MATTNGTRWTAGHTLGWRRRDRSASLIRHADICPALPVSALALPVRLSPLFGLLISMVGRPSLPLARSGTAGLAAIALTSVASDANHENNVAVQPQTTPGAKRAFGL